MHDARIEGLLAELETGDAASAAAAAEALGRLGAVEPLAAKLKHRRTEVRLFAAGALGDMGRAAAPAVARLCERLRDPAEEVRVRVAWALGEIREPAAARALAEALARDAATSAWAAEALGKIGPGAAADAREALLARLEGGEASPCFAAAAALLRIGLERSRVVARMREWLGVEEEFDRAEAAVVLGEAGAAASAAVPDLVHALEDESEEVRLQAARALHAIGAPAARAVPALDALRRDRDPQVRRAADRAWAALRDVPEDHPGQPRV